MNEDPKQAIKAATEAALRQRAFDAARQRMETAVRAQWENGQAATIAASLNNLPLPTARDQVTATDAALGVLRRLIVGSSYKSGKSLDDAVYEFKRAWFRELDNVRKMQRARAGAIETKRAELAGLGVAPDAIEKLIADMFGPDPATPPEPTAEEQAALEPTEAPGPALVGVDGSPLSVELAEAVKLEPPAA